MDAILMASGFSRRFGSADKLTAPFRGVPLVQHALELACGLSCFNRIWVVYAAPQVGALAQKYPVELVYNSRPASGQVESIRLGVAASSADHYLFLPCDQPLLDAPTLKSILAQRQKGAIVQPVYKGQPGSPVLFSAAFRKELLALENGHKAREIIQRHPGCVYRVEVPSSVVFLDVDTPDDLAKLEALSL